MSKTVKIIFTMIVVADIAVWFFISHPLITDATQLYFLDVGQGDSSLVILPGGVKVLIDGGPMNGRLQKNLEAIFPLNDRYIDLVINTHPQLDHFGGLLDIFRNYNIGAVLTNPFPAGNQYWKEFEQIIKDKKIPRIVLAEGDKIINKDSQILILSPAKTADPKDVNNDGIVSILQSNGLRAFFGADIDSKKEQEIAFHYDVNVDVLKVSHHGSKFSSNPVFLKEASPKFAMIEVGAKNTYGHPTKEALGRLTDAGAKIFHTDLNGLIEAVFDNGEMQVYTRK